jgi:hypothetical protein
MECLNCPGVSGCQTGQRVWVILDGQTEPKKEIAEPVFNHPAQKKSWNTMMEAIDSGDPKQWLIDHGRTRHCANETVRRWRNLYPDYFEKAKKCGEVQYIQREQAKAECREAIASGNPIEYVMKKFGVERNTAYSRVSSWRIHYPELFPADIKIHRKDVETHRRSTEMAKKEYREAMESGDPVAWLMEHHGTKRAVAKNRLACWKKAYGEIEVRKTEETDEISVEEFLEGLGEGGSEGNPDNDEGNPAYTEAEPGSPEGNVGSLPENNQSVLPDIKEQFEEKYGILKREKDELTEKIERMKVRLEWIEKQQEALSMVWAMFNPSTEIGRQLLTE